MADTFLKFQKNNQENALAIEPANEKLEKMAVFCHTLKMKQPHTVIGPFKKEGISRFYDTA